MNCTTLGIDLAKQVFQLHGVDERGIVIAIPKSNSSTRVTENCQASGWRECTGKLPCSQMRMSINENHKISHDPFISSHSIDRQSTH